MQTIDFDSEQSTLKQPHLTDQGYLSVCSAIMMSSHLAMTSSASCLSIVTWLNCASMTMHTDSDKCQLTRLKARADLLQCPPQLQSRASPPQHIELQPCSPSHHSCPAKSDTEALLQTSSRPNPIAHLSYLAPLWSWWGNEWSMSSFFKRARQRIFQNSYLLSISRVLPCFSKPYKP